MTRREQMVLGMFMTQAGHHEAAWRHPSSDADAGVNLDRYVSYARIAEAAKFHFVFLADTAGVRETNIDALSRIGRTDGFEPLTALAALAMVTGRIGLLATASTTFNEPYHLARKLASLDHISKGRAGWNVVTSSNPQEALNFGIDKLPEHDERYARAEEFMTVAKGLWDTWDDDAFTRDRQTGLYFEPEKYHLLNHTGRYYSVRGPLNISRPPQGHPVLAQAGSSTVGIDFAAKHGELIFSAQQTIEGAKKYYDRVKERARAYGRRDKDVLVMPGIVPIVGATEEDAERQLLDLSALVQEAPGLENASRLLGYSLDLSKYHPTDKVPRDIGETNLMQSRQRLIAELAWRRDLSVGELISLLAIGRGHLLAVGTAAQVASQMIEYFEASAADGFIVMPTVLPGGLNDFASLVVPELRRRGRFQSDYAGSSLRENLGLARPENQHAGGGRTTGEKT